MTQLINTKCSKNRAISIKNFINKKFTTMNIPLILKAFLGAPECSGSWIVFGESGNGKTTFSLQLMHFLCDEYKSAYLSLEEGMKLTFQKAVRDANLLAKGSKVTLWHDLGLLDLRKKLNESRSPRIIFIDSVQYLRSHDKSTQEISKFDYIELLREFPNKLFVFISHADKGKPKGSLADSIYFGSDICIEVKDFVAIPTKNRCGGTESYNITR